MREKFVRDYRDMHCEKCPLIEYCNSYENNPPCCQPRFENITVKDFLSVADYLENNCWTDEDEFYEFGDIDDVDEMEI